MSAKTIERQQRRNARGRVTWSLFGAATLAFVLFASPASAKQTRVFGGTFGSATSIPSDPYPLGSVSGMAVDQSSHDVYVGDPVDHRVEKFTEGGEFILMFGKEVNETAVEQARPEAEQNVCPDLGHPGDACQPGTAGTSPGAFVGAFPSQGGTPKTDLYLAVDNSTKATAGDVYVGDPGGALVQRFDSSGHLDTSWAENGKLSGVGITHPVSGPLDEIGGIAVDPAGDLWVESFNSTGQMFEFAANASFVTGWPVGNFVRYGIAVSSEDELFLMPRVFASDGTLISEFDDLSGGIDEGVATDTSSGETYVYGSISRAIAGAFPPPVIARYAASCRPTLPIRCTPAEEFGAKYLPNSHPQLDRGLAVDGSSPLDTVYAGVDDQVVSFPFATVPDIVTAAPTELSTTSAVLNGTVNPSGVSLNEGLTGCRFEWGESTAYGHEAPCSKTAAQIGSGKAPVEVHANLAGLTPGVTYHFRLVASNANDVNVRTSEPSVGEDARFGPPLVDSESVSSVTATSATLEGQVDPQNADTHARLEYLSEAEFEENGSSFSGLHPAVAVPVPAADLGAGEGDRNVSHHLQNLQPHTVYRFRVMAESVLASGPEAVSGSAQAFTTQNPAPFALPDSRGWELVSPSNKQGALIYPLGGAPTSKGASIQAAADGDAMTYVADAPTEPEPQGYANGVQILSARSSSGWISKDIATPHVEASRASIGRGEEYRLFSPDLARGLIQPFGAFTAGLSPAASEQSPFLRTDFSPSGSICAESCYQPLVTGCPAAEACPPAVEALADVPAGTVFAQPCPRTAQEVPFFCGPEFEGASADLHHVVFTSELPLIEGKTGLYEWNADAPPAEALKPLGEGELGHSSGTKPEVRHAVSADGSRVFFAHAGSLAMRDTETEETVTLGPSTFEDAAADGSRAFFQNGGELREWRAEGISGCEEAEGCTSDLTGGSGLMGTMIGASEDGSYVYFVSNGVLAANEGADGSHAEPGDCPSEGFTAAETCNLYLSHEGATTFIAAISGADNTDWGNPGSLQELSARVSPNGRWLAFTSQRPLTGYDNDDATTGKPDQEVYLYHAEAAAGEQTLACASCNPTGARPRGVEARQATLVNNSGTYGSATQLAAAIPGWNPVSLVAAQYQSRYLSDAGRLFFDSPDALVPQDTNGTWDVYEFEAERGGAEEPPSDSCTEASPTYVQPSSGCVSLITSGASPGESAFLDASESGDDAFFITAARLSSRDVDSAYDVYDARVGGREVEPIAPVECIGDGCQRPAVPPEDHTPGSLSYSGPGNETPPSKTRKAACAKGRTARHGKCVKKNSHKKKAAPRRAGRKQGGRK